MNVCVLVGRGGGVIKLEDSMGGVEGGRKEEEDEKEEEEKCYIAL